MKNIGGVSVYIKRLREKIFPLSIETKMGFGYRLNGGKKDDTKGD
jgi:DNA-binding response OmpR family regulator